MPQCRISVARVWHAVKSRRWAAWRLCAAAGGLRHAGVRKAAMYTSGAFQRMQTSFVVSDVGSSR